MFGVRLFGVLAGFLIQTCRAQVCVAPSIPQMHVLNPPYNRRSYSSIAGPTQDHSKSLLDDRLDMMCWAAAVVNLDQRIELDAGEAMYITGVITQNRGQSGWTTQYVSEFSVQHRLLVTDQFVTLPGKFTATSATKIENLFESSVYARYIRLLPSKWNVHISMRIALVVTSCSNECPVDKFKYISDANMRALSVVFGRAQLSTLANRNLRIQPSTATFVNTAGPNAKAAITFERPNSQYVSGGTHTFNLNSRPGFTVVAVVQFSGTPANDENIFDFGGSPNIKIARSQTSSVLYFSMQQGATLCSVSSAVGGIVQEAWLTIIATYTSISNVMTLRIASIEATNTCSATWTDMAVSHTTLGNNFNGKIAGFYAVDDILDAKQLDIVITQMLSGQDYSYECKPKPFRGIATCGGATPSIMTTNICAKLTAGTNMYTHTAAALGTTQLVRYTFDNSWGCNAQATLLAAQRISGAAPNQVLNCAVVPGAVYVKADAPCQFACTSRPCAAT